MKRNFQTVIALFVTTVLGRSLPAFSVTVLFTVTVFFTVIVLATVTAVDGAASPAVPCCVVFAQPVLGWSLPAFTGDPTPRLPSDDEVNVVAKQLYCPVCENIPLDVCPTQACAEWRDLIREKLALGWSDKQIKQYFVDQYGDRVVGTPPARGLNWLVYIIPPLVIIAGVYVLYRAFRTWKKPAPQVLERTGEMQTDDEYIKRLEEELRKQ